MVDILEITKKVLTRLVSLDNETINNNSSEQLIFPKKRETNRSKKLFRISEQEMRLLFIEEFKKDNPSLYYSIETPTSVKYKFSKILDECKVDIEGQSASHDMSVFEKNDSSYKRILNIEFKHNNSGIEKSGKDILKLVKEEQNGAFIQLLETTNDNTLVSVFTKLLKCFTHFEEEWENKHKTIQLVILSLAQKKLIHCEIRKIDLLQLNNYFGLEGKLGNIESFNNKLWNIVDLKIANVTISPAHEI